MEGPVLKRPRLSLACNTCRLRKVKCDADYPQCRNCRVRNQACITSDPRRPNEPVVRRWVETPEKPPKGSVKPVQGTESQMQSNLGQTSLEVVPSSEMTHDGTPPHQPIEEGISPIHQQLDPLVNTDHGTNRTKIVGGSSSQGLMRSLDVYFRAVHLQPVSGMFLHGMKHAEELPMPLEVFLPNLPESWLRDRYLTTFLEKIHPLYPIFDVDALRSIISQLSSRDSMRHASSELAPSLTSVYLVMALGADEEKHRVTAEGERYLRAAASLLGHIIVVPYLPTVQSLLMFTLVFRGRNSEGLGWQTLGMAIRISYTLGIHRYRMVSSSKHVSGHSLEKRIWAVCYSLERTMQLDSGRPTVITEPINNDQFLPLEPRPESNLLKWHLELAEYQGQISQHIYGHATKSRTAREIFEDTCRLDQELMCWANSIPPEMRPGNDLFCSRKIYHIAAFISIMYHETMIALHRAALIAPNATFEAEVERHCPSGPSRFRIRGGEAICVNSARSIARLSIELADQSMDTRLLPTGVPLLACIVLAIYLMKHPESALHATDLQLLKACLELCSEQFTKSNMDQQFIQGLTSIHERVDGYLTAYQTGSKRSKVMRTMADVYSPTYSNSMHDHISPRVYSTSQVSPASNTGTSIDNRKRTMPLCHSLARNQITQCQNRPNYREEIADDALYSPSGTQQILIPENVIASGTPRLRTSPTDKDYQSPLQNDMQFPFEGYNVENLWNWMLEFDP